MLGFDMSDSENEEEMLERAIAMSLEDELGSGVSEDEDKTLKRAIAMSLEVHIESEVVNENES